MDMRDQMNTVPKLPSAAFEAFFAMEARAQAEAVGTCLGKQAKRELINLFLRTRTVLRKHDKFSTDVRHRIRSMERKIAECEKGNAFFNAELSIEYKKQLEGLYESRGALSEMLAKLGANLKLMDGPMSALICRDELLDLLNVNRVRRMAIPESANFLDVVYVHGAEDSASYENLDHKAGPLFRAVLAAFMELSRSPRVVRRVEATPDEFAAFSAEIERIRASTMEAFDALSDVRREELMLHAARDRNGLRATTEKRIKITESLFKYWNDFKAAAAAIDEKTSLRQRFELLCADVSKISDFPQRASLIELVSGFVEPADGTFDFGLLLYLAVFSNSTETHDEFKAAQAMRQVFLAEERVAASGGFVHAIPNAVQ
jgi:hypothetical protein